MKMDEFDVIAEMLDSGWDPSEITLLRVLERRLRAFFRDKVEFELAASNIDRPNKGDYDPRWCTAQGILTALNEGLTSLLEPPEEPALSKFKEGGDATNKPKPDRAL